jgi:3-(3-hydroxy-phenyl)propionate hydroxylase
MTLALPDRVDVLVVGYGPVGATLTCLLGRYGVPTLTIDKAADIFAAPRAIALDNEALRILQLAGLAGDAFERIPIPFVRMRCPQVGEFARVDTSGTIDGHPKLATFYQPDLERALRATAAGHSSVTTATGVELAEFVDDDGAIRATVRTADGAEHVVRARFLVGADGASSRVRAAIGQDFTGETYSEDWLIVDALGVPGDFDHVEFLCDSRRPTPHMIAPGGRTRWEFMLQPGEMREEMETDDSIRRLLAPWTGAVPVTIERKAVYRFHARSCARYSVGNVFLVGDAAHITPPFVGQGLVAGLRDAANLAWKLAWVARGRASRSILDTYDEERRTHATKMIALAKLMGRVIMPRSKLTAVLVHGAIKVARSIPGVRAYLEKLGIKPKPRFDRGLFVRGRRGRVRRGDLLPQVLVRSPDGSIAMSDDVLGPRLAVVGFGDDPLAYMSADTRRQWVTLGGGTVTLASPASTGAGGAHLVIQGGIEPDVLQRRWCAVVRPDRTVLHDGPAAEADRIVREAMALLATTHGARG